VKNADGAPFSCSKIPNTVIIDTTDNNDDKGVVIVSERTETLVFDEAIDGGREIIAIDTVSLVDIRNEIAKENMSLPLFAISNVSLKMSDSSSSVSDLARAQKAVITIASYLPNETPQIALLTPDSTDYYPMETLGEILDGVYLNNGLYSNSGGLKSFEDKIKDTSKDKIIFKGVLRVDGAVQLPKDLSLDFTIEGTSKKKI